MALKPQKHASKSSPDGLERHGFMRTHKVALALWKRSVLWLSIVSIESHTDLVSGKIDSYHIDPSYEFMTYSSVQDGQCEEA